MLSKRDGCVGISYTFLYIVIHITADVADLTAKMAATHLKSTNIFSVWTYIAHIHFL